MVGREDQKSALRRRWEERAACLGDDIVSVLFKGFSEPLNRYIHHWHVTLLSEHLLPRLAHGARVLDLGCGYGRLSRELLKIRPDLQITGLDFSNAYCRRYHATVGASVACGDLRWLPFPDASFDGVLAVVALMYIAPDETSRTMAGIMRLLRPEGLALFLDPGEELLTVARKVLPSASARTTGGRGFRLAEYRGLGRNEDSVVMKEGGNLGFTLLLPILLLLRTGRCLAALLKLSSFLDARLSRLRRYALHRWMLVRRQVSSHGG
ncbi:MAG: methyltransferase domain-containing protein [Sulfuricaulis sp.]